MIFIHGCPELSIVWRRQLEHFGEQGWRCIAPDMRGYGGSSMPDAIGAYAVREIVADMVELHEALGGRPAVWVGHDWGSPIAWGMASHHPERCRGVVNLCVPYLARGTTLSTLGPLVDRSTYPADRYPVGQWDYWLFYREHFSRAVADFETDVASTLNLHYQRAQPWDRGTRAFTADVRANGGWFGEARHAPQMPRDPSVMNDDDFATLVAAFERSGFSGPFAWYVNDAANHAFADEAPNFGKLSMPALFIHAARDQVCDTLHSRLAEPMREDVPHLTEVSIDGGHELMLECPDETNAAISAWLETVLSKEKNR